jgi:hypothetical protein
MHATVRALPSERPGISSENSDKRSEISDAMRMVRIAAGPRLVGDSIKAAIGRAARALGWSFTRTRDIWYGDARRLDAKEFDALRAIQRERDAAITVAEKRRHLEQIAVLRTRLSIRDADFHRSDIEALDFLLDALRQG